MARITLDAEIVQEILQGMRFQDCVNWAAKQTGKVTLKVPDPYKHSLTGPLNIIRNCTTKIDECGGFGVYVGVLDKLPKQRK